MCRRNWYLKLKMLPNISDKHFLFNRCYWKGLRSTSSRCNSIGTNPYGKLPFLVEKKTPYWGKRQLQRTHVDIWLFWTSFFSTKLNPIKWFQPENLANHFFALGVAHHHSRAKNEVGDEELRLRYGWQRCYNNKVNNFLDVNWRPPQFFVNSFL